MSLYLYSGIASICLSGSFAQSVNGVQYMHGTWCMALQRSAKSFSSASLKLSQPESSPVYISPSALWNERGMSESARTVDTSVALSWFTPDSSAPQLFHPTGTACSHRRGGVVKALRPAKCSIPSRQSS